MCSALSSTYRMGRLGQGKCHFERIDRKLFVSHWASNNNDKKEDNEQT